jgi:cytochrome P450
MWRLADQLIDEFVADERCEFASANGQPFPLLVIADLLGVPETDHSMFRELLAGKGPGVAQRDEDGRVNMNPLAYLDKWFTAYISDRRDTPTRDMLTEMATRRFADGSLPEVVDVVRIATFLFIAGHETTARLLSSALRAGPGQAQRHSDRRSPARTGGGSSFRLRAALYPSGHGSPAHRVHRNAMTMDNPLQA